MEGTALAKPCACRCAPFDKLRINSAKQFPMYLYRFSSLDEHRIVTESESFSHTTHILLDRCSSTFAGNRVATTVGSLRQSLRGSGKTLELKDEPKTFMRSE